MHFVLDHGAQPFPGGDGGTTHGFTFAIQVFLRETEENFHRLTVHALDVIKDIVIAIGELAAAAVIAAGLALGIFREHVSLDGGDVARQIAQGEFPFVVGPFDLVGRDAAQDANRAGVNFFEVVQEFGKALG